MTPEHGPDVEAALDGENRAALWTYVWVMVGFKIVTAIILLWFTHTLYTVGVLIALHIPWLVAALLLAGAPSAFYYRLMRVRARREELIRQEFEVDPPSLEGAPVPVA